MKQNANKWKISSTIGIWKRKTSGEEGKRKGNGESKRNIISRTLKNGQREKGCKGKVVMEGK